VRGEEEAQEHPASHRGNSHKRPCGSRLRHLPSRFLLAATTQPGLACALAVASSSTTCSGWDVFTHSLMGKEMNSLYCLIRVCGGVGGSRGAV
jgi:hypothetical protein